VLTSKSQLAVSQILAGLSSPDGTLVLSTLNDVESQPPAKNLLQLLETALTKVRDPVLVFQIRKTWRKITLALKGKRVVVHADTLEKLLPCHDRLADLALAISCLEHTEAILAIDLLRTAAWHEFPPPILPTFCFFFKKYGNLQDSPNLVELSRNPDPTVLTSALEALEVVDPGNLQSLITPLLTSPLPVIRGQAIRALFRWDKVSALKNLSEMLLAGNSHEQFLGLHYSGIFPFADVEPMLIRFVTENSDPKLLVKVSQIMKDNAYPDLPFKLYWICRNLKEQHQTLVKGILMGVARCLCESGAFTGTVQDFLEQLKQRIKAEEEKADKATLKKEPAQTEVAAPAVDQKTAERAPEPLGAGLPDIDPPSLKKEVPVVPVQMTSVEDYDELEMVKRVQFLGKMTQETYSIFRSRIPRLMQDCKGKELAALLKAIGRFGKSEDAGMIRKFLLSSDNPDEACAAIDALSKLDSEYLCLYLPQLMQSKNGKIRVTATRIFVAIDPERIKSLLEGLLRSTSSRQRMLAMPATVLVDFPLVREALMKAFEKEASPELIDKMGIVLSANPDREILRLAYRAFKNSGQNLSPEKLRVVDVIAEKLAIALEKTVTPEQLIKAEETAFSDELQSSADCTAKNAPEPMPALPAAAPKNPPSVKQILIGQDSESKTRRASVTMVVWVLVVLVWGFLVASFVVKFLFSGG